MIQYLKCVYKEVEYWLYNYQQFKSELETALKDFAYSRSSFASEYIPNTGYVSNPVERAYLEYEKKFYKIEKWCKVIEKALEILKNEHKKKYMLLILRYFQGYRKERVIEELDINEKTYHKWKDDIVSLVAVLAIEHGLLKIKT